MARLTGKIDRVNPALIERVELIEVVELYATSGFREGDLLSHGDGDALDLMCENSRLRYRILRDLLGSNHGPPIQRIGIGPRHIHVDISPRLPNAVCFFTGGFEDGSS